MVELKAPNGCVVQASDEAAPRLLDAGFVHVGETAALEQPKPKARRRTTKEKTTTKE